MKKYYVGPLIGSGTAKDSFRAPAGAGMVLLGRKKAFLWSESDLGSNYTLIASGDIKSIKLDSAQRKAFASRLGLETVAGDTLADCLYSVLTIHAEEGGRNPIMPSVYPHGAFLPLIVHGETVASVPFVLGTPHAAPVVKVLQKEYRELRLLAQQGKLKDDKHHLRVLDARLKELRAPGLQALIQEGLPEEAPVDHETTITDDFNRSNSSSLGTAAGGWSWAQYYSAGSGLTSTSTMFGIASNSAADQGGNANWCLSRAESDLSSANHSAEFTITAFSVTALNPQIGPRVRCATGADGTSYLARAIQAGPNLVNLTSIDSNGGLTDIASVGQAVALGKVLKLTFNGSAYAINYDGSDIATGTDTGISSGLRTGIFDYCPFGTGSLVACDDFSASDVGGGASIVGSYYYRYVGGMGG